MLKTRCEEYNSISSYPCLYFEEIERTDKTLTEQSDWHENLEIELCVEGSGYVIIDGKKSAFKKGDIAVINSNSVHYTGTDRRLVYTQIVIDSDFCKKAGIDHRELFFESFISDFTLRQSFERIGDAYKSREEIRGAKVQCAILEFLIVLRSKHINPKKMTNSQIKHSEIVKQTIRLIREEYKQKLTLDYIAKKVCADKFGLSRIFKEITGQSVVTYINNFRCKKAAELISNGMKIKRAAQSCGFNNISFFTKTFKEFAGKLPSEIKTPRF